MTLNFPSAAAAWAYSSAAMAEGHKVEVSGVTRIVTRRSVVVAWASALVLGLVFGLVGGFAEVGWGYAEPGHNTLLANPSDWREVVPSGVLSHMGKHGMLMLTNPDGTLPEVVTNYLSGPLKPTRTHPSQQVFNFAWILGPDASISDATMRQYSELLEVQGLR